MTSASLIRKAAKAAVLPVGLANRRAPNDLVMLLYHRVGAGSREIDLTAGLFEEHLQMLGQSGRVTSIDAAISGIGGVVVTFDDGYRDFHEHVLPLLMRYAIPAVLYLATGMVGSGSKSDALEWSHLREAIATGLVTIGAHTHNHAELSRATEQDAAAEMARSKGLIEDRLGVKCRHFAYPWGVASEGAERVARRLFTTAALRWGTNRAGRLDLHRLARTPVLRSDGNLFFRAKVRGALDGEALVYRLLHRGPWRRS